MNLPPFPVDEITLNALAHALDGALDLNTDGEPILVGAECTVTQLLDFLSGYDAGLLVPAVNQYDTELPDVDEYPHAIYHRDDAIRALIGEVRRLRHIISLQPPQ